MSRTNAAATTTHETLNDQQRRAVEHEGSPLIVLAGPGTGKTRVITERVAHLVDVRGVRPESVVALTFTVKAAEEMRERLASRVGGGRADRVAAMTFHGFGWKLLHRFADMLGLPGEIQLLDSAQQREMVRELIVEHDLFPGYAAQGPGVLVDDVNRHLEYLANHGISPEQAEKEAEAWRVRLEAGQFSSATRVFPASVNGSNGDRSKRRNGTPAPVEDAEHAERLRCAWFADLAKLNTLLTNQRRERGLLAFSDLILEPIRLLRDHELARALCHADFRSFVVDEFQDVNAAQIEFLRLLAPPKPGRDVCVVGDDDQSIYAFRGADEQAFERFRRIWTDAQQIELTKNYRSSRAIISIANFTISRADRRFAPDKVIEPANPNDPVGPNVECVGLASYAHDGETIAAMIRAEMAGDKGKGRKLDSYAVVARNNSDLDRIASALTLEGIPVRLLRVRSPLDDDGVKDVFSWIDILIDPAAEWAARRLLLRPPFCAEVEDVVRWGREFRALRSRDMVAEGLAGKEGRRPRRGAARNFIRFLSTRTENHPVAKRFVELYQKLRAIDGHRTADETIFRIVTLADIAHADLVTASQRAVRIANLVALLRFVRQRQDRLPAPGDLRTFRAYYDDLNDDEQSLQSIGENAIDSSFDEIAPLAVVDDVTVGRSDSDNEPDGATESAGANGQRRAEDIGGVQLLTAHRAKGLEFDTVFVPRIMPRNGYGSTKAEQPLNVPPGLGELEDDRDWKTRQQDEERRVFYVACTRAQRRLVLLSQRQKSSSSMHLWRELAMPPRPHVSVVSGEDVMSAAARAGVLARLADPLAAAAVDFAALGAREDASQRQAAEARRQAVRALARAEEGSESALAQAEAGLRLAAARMCAAGLIARAEDPPAWLHAAFPDLAEETARVVARVREGQRTPASIAAVIARMIPEPIQPPLRLSFSAIKSYLVCPRCYFLKEVLRLEDRPYSQRDIGTIVHESLERFYRDWRDADAEGRMRPGLKELEELGRRTFFRRWPKSDPVDDAQFKQILAQLRLAYGQLHSDADHVMELELKVEAPYDCDGCSHTLVAKIDRIDQVGDGWRIIDYKTGKARQELAEPPNDDLQLGIYALALAHHLRAGREAMPLFDSGPDPVTGVAEYWLLSTGQRGSIALQQIDMVAVKSQIDQAIRGILARRFDEKGKQCYGDCDFLGG